MLYSYALYGVERGGSPNPKPPHKEIVEEVHNSIEKVNIPIPSKVTGPGQAIQDGRIYAYRRELEEALQSSAFDFFRMMKSEEKGFSIFSQMTRVPQKNTNSTVQQNKQLYDTAFYAEALNLLIAITPPLGKQDRKGFNASDLAQMEGNQEFYTVLQKHSRIQSRFELKPGDKTDFWANQIKLIPLEQHPVAQAILSENPKALYQALKVAFSNPAKDFLSLLHSRTTKEHKSLFHLSAEVKSHKAEIAQAIDGLITFSAPNKINFAKNGYDYHKATSKEIIAMGAGWAGLIVGLPSSAHFFLSGQGGLGTLSFLLAAGSLGFCQRVFNSNSKTDSIIKNRRF